MIIRTRKKNKQKTYTNGPINMKTQYNFNPRLCRTENVTEERPHPVDPQPANRPSQAAR